MKALWIGLAVLGGLCLLCAGGGYWLFSRGKSLYDEGVVFAGSSFRTVAHDWNYEEFRALAAPGTQRPDREFFDDARRNLGPLKSASPGHVTAFKIRALDGDNAAFLDWTTDATFEMGEGQATLTVVGRGGTWKIYAFNVESPRLAHQADGSAQNDEPEIRR